MTQIPLPLTHVKACDLGQTLWRKLTAANDAVGMARDQLPAGDAYLNMLVADSERMLNAHRVHQTSCQQCLARNQELNDLGKEPS